MTAPGPITFLVAGCVVVFVCRLPVVLVQCQRAAEYWKLRTAARWFLALLAFDVFFAVLAYLAFALSVQQFDRAPAWAALFGVPLGGAATGMRQWRLVQRRLFPGLRGTDMRERKSFQDHVVLQIGRICAHESSQWIEQQALPALRRYDLASLEREAKTFLSNVPSATTKQRLDDARFVSDMLGDEAQSLDDRITVVCNRILKRGGRRKLESLVDQARRRHRA